MDIDIDYKEPMLPILNSEAFTCEICIEPQSSAQKFHHKNCVHNICVTCITGYIQAKVDENIASIKCPQLDCKEILDPIESRSVIPPELLVKWCDCLCTRAILSLKHGYCPNRYCSEPILNECNESVEKCKCPICKMLFCYKCGVPWHAGYWCTESHQNMDSNDKLFGDLVEKMKWTRCRRCGQSTELIQGCTTVICRCGRSFCHACGGLPHYGPCESTKIPLLRGENICALICGHVFFLLYVLCLYFVFRQSTTRQEFVVIFEAGCLPLYVVCMLIFCCRLWGY